LTISILNTGFTSSTIDPTALQPQSIQLIPNLLIDFSLILKNQFSRNNTKGTLRLVFMQVNSLQQLEKKLYTLQIWEKTCTSREFAHTFSYGRGLQ
jgi:hypothetical protein